MSTRATRLLFASTTFVAAALVFLVQPMVARQLLPTFGGTPGVWNTTVVFFQVALLVGYGIAHASATLLDPRRQPFVQLVLAALTVPFLPLALAQGAGADATDAPALRILVLLGAGVGIPYLAVTTVSPALQRWYAAIGQPDSDDPYFLYVASNAGSLVGLLAFPFLLEPQLASSGQAAAWTVAFIAFTTGLVGCSLVVSRRGDADADSRSAATAVDVPDATPQLPHVDARPGAPDQPIGALRALRWVAIAAIPSALMLGVTTFITTDVASAPMLWVLPLALYLVSFMVTFGRRLRVGVRAASVLAAASIVAVLLAEVGRIDPGSLVRTLLHLAAMFFAAVLAHASLYADRPDARRLTGFYLLLSIGGAIGGMFVALVAPATFDGVYEYPLLLAAVLLLRPRAALERIDPRSMRSVVARSVAAIVELTVAGLLLLVLLADVTSDSGTDQLLTGAAGLAVVIAALALLGLRRWGLVLVTTVVLAALTVDGDDVVFAERSFYGTVRVEETDQARRLLHGTTLHGAQLTSSDERRTPTTYYTTEGPVGDAFELLQRDEPFVDVGVVGLGSGALLAHARLWQRFTFYEIDPTVVRVARDPDLFTWISDSDVTVDVVVGDARLRIADEPAGRFDLLVLDAYSSDAVPVHLLTVEALEAFLRTVHDDGAILLHVSSRHLDLEPVVSANVERLGLVARQRVDGDLTRAQDRALGAGSHWIVLARDERSLEALEGADGWRPLVEVPDGEAWTDDHSDVVGTIEWLPDRLR